MVARSFSWLFKISNINLDFLDSDFLSLSFWWGDNEKNATSEPEINAEENNKIKLPTKPI